MKTVWIFTLKQKSSKTKHETVTVNLNQKIPNIYKVM